MLVPDSAHGTNPASAVMAGFRIKEIPTTVTGDLDLIALEKALGPQTAGIMLTNPTTLGLFERQIEQIASMVHGAGGLLYYDGANLNAILGRVRPGDMGFDVLHFNLHKTFATPHGGGGPGAGPIAVSKTLLPYLPVPRVQAMPDKNRPNGWRYDWLTEKDCPHSIGQLSAFMGNVGILLRAAVYLRLLGRQGLRRVSDMATLNANYLMRALEDAGFTLAYPDRKSSHEFILTFKKWAKEKHINAMELAKRLLDYGIHAPTTYFPLCVPECWLIEPTETETLETLNRFVEAMQAIKAEVISTPETIKTAPHTLPVKRLDDVRAVKCLDVVYADDNHH
jgi:glycine dehydrogenase subunit 2